MSLGVRFVLLLMVIVLALSACLRQPAPVGLADERTPMPLYLLVEPADLNHLYERDPFSNEMLPGSFRTSLDEPWTPLRDEGIRFRGSSSRVQPKKSFSVRFQDPEPFAFGTSRLNLVAMWTDPSFMRAVLAFDMFRELGVITSGTRYIDLFLNDVYEGLYVAVQRVDGDLLASNGFSLDGSTLVRDEFRDSRPGGVASMFSYDWSAEADPVALLQETVDSRGDPDWEALWELVRWVHETPAGPSFASGFAARVDIDSFIDWLAIHVLIADVDSFADDYWLFLDGSRSDARWQFIPWDKDLSFGSSWVSGFGVANDFLHLEFTPYSGWSNALVRRFLDTEELHQRFVARLVTLMRDAFTVDWIASEIADIAPRIEASVSRAAGPNAFERHPANHFGDLGYFNDHTEALVSFIERRYAFLTQTLVSPDVGAERYVATVELPESAGGSQVLLTDGAGWTIAKLDVTNIEGADVVVTASVHEDTRFSSIDRRWYLSVEGGRVDAFVTLFYRNNPVEGNWYRVADDSIVAIGEQRSLTLASVFDVDAPWDVDVEMRPSTVNPYANAVTTVAPMALHGAHTMAIVNSSTRR